MGAALACKLDEYQKSQEIIEGTPKADFWGSYTVTKSRAGQILTGLKPELQKNYLLTTNELEYIREVETPHGVITCDQGYMMD